MSDTNSNSKNEMEILLKYFDTARANINTRLAARDNSLLLYLAGVAGLATAAFSSENAHYDVLLLIIPISTGIAAITLQHNYVMDSLYEYVWDDIFIPLMRIGYKHIP